MEGDRQAAWEKYWTPIVVVQALHGGDDAAVLSGMAEAAVEGDKAVHRIAHEQVQTPNWEYVWSGLT